MDIDCVPTLHWNVICLQLNCVPIHEGFWKWVGAKSVQQPTAACSHMKTF